jgi:hypothetical protein
MAFGSFTRFNGVNSPRIARLLEDGTLDVNFNFCFWSHNIVRTAVVQKMVKVIAGSFTSYNGVNNRITRILRMVGLILDLPLEPLLTIKFMQLRFSRTKNNCCG